ncbi:FAS1-like dehydratase domain-containing protein [Sphingomonas adhaesiva]|uniref:FAS1-like dehydratase domain-containing protein n=1 Tax=Sphingomonas adhaesiva TaxID=28212 RepID=UPI002FF95517
MTTIDETMVAQWREAIGRRVSQRQVLHRGDLRRFAVAVGCETDDAAVPLPHWAFFLPMPADREIGEDGHPRRGDFLPAITLQRRMFAAAAMTFEVPLTLDEEATLDSEIVDVRHKSGRSGDLVFVEVERIVRQAGTVRVRERQSYVYRDHGARVAMPEAVTPSPAGERWQPDEVRLFRFSAATFNSHRIHYDLPYATAVEGYPALVVHGPFTAARLAALAARRGTLAGFSFRAEAPLFLGQPVFLETAGDDVVQAVRCDGAVAMRATVAYR